MADEPYSATEMLLNFITIFELIIVIAPTLVSSGMTSFIFCSTFALTHRRTSSFLFWRIMIDIKTFREMALSFPFTEEVKHFERTGFKPARKRMFATYLAANNTANIFLTPAEQALFCKIDSVHIYPVANKWGEKGATTFELNTVEMEIVREALLFAYNNVLKTKK